MIIKKEYKIISCSNLDIDYYYIQKTVYIFGQRIWISFVGEYKDGNEEEIPFTCFYTARERLNKLKKK